MAYLAQLAKMPQLAWMPQLAQKPRLSRVNQPKRLNDRTVPNDPTGINDPTGPNGPCDPISYLKSSFYRRASLTKGATLESSKESHNGSSGYSFKSWACAIQPAVQVRSFPDCWSRGTKTSSTRVQAILLAQLTRLIQTTQLAQNDKLD